MKCTLPLNGAVVSSFMQVYSEIKLAFHAFFNRG